MTGATGAASAVGPVTVFAPAKLTLRLQITGVRDDGFHLIDADMAELELADVLTIDPHGIGLAADGPYSLGMPLDESNLIAKALRVVGRTANIHVTKNVPHGGGLGGGSADAAAVLRWAGFTDLAGAARLGADVAFCLVGGRARVRGIGELVEATQATAFDITLVIPPLTCSTPAVYAAWDALGGPTGHPHNDLTPAALAVEPGLAIWRDRIREACGTEPILAGSGATWFLGGRVAGLVEALPDATVVFTRTAGPTSPA